MNGTRIQDGALLFPMEIDERLLFDVARRLETKLGAKCHVFGFDFDDILQEARIVALHMDDVPKDKVGGFLFYRTMNALTVRYKTHRRRRDIRVEVDAVAPDERVEAKVEAEDVLRRLPPEIREIVRRHFWEDEPYTSLASREGVTGTALSMRVRYAFARLRGQTYKEHMEERARNASDAKEKKLEYLRRDASNESPRVQEYIRLYLSGMTCDAIGELYGVAGGTVNAHLLDFIARQSGTYEARHSSRLQRINKTNLRKRLDAEKTTGRGNSRPKKD